MWIGAGAIGLGLVALALALAGRGRPSGGGAGATAAGDAAPSPAGPAELDSLPSRRVPAPPSAPAVDASVANAPVGASEVARAPIRGRVVDPRGVPRAGLGVGYSDEDSVRAWSDSAGGFDLAPRDAPGVLVARDPEWATLRGSEVAPERSRPLHLVVVAPAIDVDGFVVDEQLRGIEGAHVLVVHPDEAFAGFPFPLDATTVTPLSIETDASGRFAFERIAGLAGAVLEARHDQHPDAWLRIPGRDAQGLLLVMRAPGDDAPRVVGTVVRPNGEPASGARIALAPFTATADESGRFELVLRWVPPRADLVAVEPGWQPVVLAGFAAEVVAAAGAPVSVRLVLGPPALRIAGEVLRADGEPAPGFRVSIADGAEWLPGTSPPTWLEGLASRGANEVVSDADGRFVLDGLRARDYRVQAWSADTLELVRSEPVPAGTGGLRLVLSAEPHHERLRGRVVSAEGRAFAGALVRAQLVWFETERGSDWIDGPAATTGADGAFELERVPRAHVTLEVSGAELIPSRHPLAGFDATRPIEIVARPRCAFRVECADGVSPKPDGLQALDEAGTRVAMFLLASNQWQATTHVALSEGRSPPLSLGPGRYALVFLRESAEVGRVPLDLAPPAGPDEVATVELRAGG